MPHDWLLDTEDNDGRCTNSKCKCPCRTLRTSAMILPMHPCDKRRSSPAYSVPEDTRTNQRSAHRLRNAYAEYRSLCIVVRGVSVRSLLPPRKLTHGKPVRRRRNTVQMQLPNMKRLHCRAETYNVSRKQRCLILDTHSISRETSSPLSTSGSVFGRLPNGTIFTAHGRGNVWRYRYRRPQTAFSMHHRQAKSTHSAPR